MSIQISITFSVVKYKGQWRLVTLFEPTQKKKGNQYEKAHTTLFTLGNYNSDSL